MRRWKRRGPNPAGEVESAFACEERPEPASDEVGGSRSSRYIRQSVDARLAEKIGEPARAANSAITIAAPINHIDTLAQKPSPVPINESRTLRFTYECAGTARHGHPIACGSCILPLTVRDRNGLGLLANAEAVCLCTRGGELGHGSGAYGAGSIDKHLKSSLKEERDI
jgi:hypothetical protein